MSKSVFESNLMVVSVSYICFVLMRSRHRFSLRRAGSRALRGRRSIFGRSFLFLLLLFSSKHRLTSRHVWLPLHVKMADMVRHGGDQWTTKTRALIYFIITHDNVWSIDNLNLALNELYQQNIYRGIRYLSNPVYISLFI